MKKRILWIVGLTVAFAMLMFLAGCGDQENEEATEIKDAVEQTGTPVTVMSPVAMNSFAEQYNFRTACEYLSSGKVVIFGAGLGIPYISTDTACVVRAAEIGADIILMAKNVDGVYSADPAKDPNAVKYDEVNIQEVIDKNLQVVDITASILARDNEMEMYVFSLNEENSIVNTVKGQFKGTKVLV